MSRPREPGFSIKLTEDTLEDGKVIRQKVILEKRIPLADLSCVGDKLNEKFFKTTKESVAALETIVAQCKKERLKRV
jgi:hypothetical protein